MFESEMRPLLAAPSGPALSADACIYCGALLLAAAPPHWCAWLAVSRAVHALIVIHAAVLPHALPR